MAFDTSTDRLSVAVADAEGTLAEKNIWAPRSQSEQLFPVLERILDEMGTEPQAILGVAVGLGPGSYTGLRIGVATARGLAQALQRPVVGVASLDAVAQGLCETEKMICPVVDAKRGQVYAALYDCEQGRVRRLDDFMVLSPRELVNHITSRNREMILAGDALTVYDAYFRKRLGRVALAPEDLWYPRASHLFMLAKGSLASGSPEELPAVVPNYLRLSQAEEKLAAKNGLTQHDSRD